VRRIVDDLGSLPPLSAQDVGMLASGTIAMATADGGRWRGAADALVACIRHNLHEAASGLFYNQARGVRRRFSSFASQVYPNLALYQYAEAFGADWALRMANGASAKLIALQGRRGEWAWFYDVASGRIVDFYEVFSVHQHGMAPAFLHHAVAHGVPDARAALVRGFQWLFGDNEMGVSMLRAPEHMFYRSQARRGELGRPWRRAARSIGNALLGRSDAVERHGALALRRECRSYELGWALWSFGGRSDYRELTDRREFTA
jgi:hypothetical protein